MPNTASRLRPAVALALAATALWPLQEYTGGLLIREHHAAQVVALRYITHLLLLCAWVLPRQGFRGFATARPVLQMVRGLCMFGMPASWILASKFSGQPWVWTMFWMLPLLALAGGHVVARERASIGAWAAALLGVVGAAAIWRAAPGNAAGTILALCMSGSFAGYLVLSRVLRDEPLGASLFYTGAGALLPMALVVWRVWTPVTPGDIVPAVLTGAISILILACFDLSLHAGTLALVAPLLALVPAWETLLAVPLHGRGVGASAVVGIALVIAAALLAIASGARAQATGPGSDDAPRPAVPQPNLEPRPTPSAGTA